MGNAEKKAPRLLEAGGFMLERLAMPYFHEGKPLTIIGAEAFHDRVRDGIGWDHLAMVARQTGKR